MARAPHAGVEGNEREDLLQELMRTNDLVLLSFVETLLGDLNIGHFVADQNMSVMEGSIGVLPRRVMVEADRLAEARKALQDAGVEASLFSTS